jgi:DNA modification methylase
MLDDRVLLIEYFETSRLWPSPRNSRVHSNKQIRQIAKSIRTFGFTNPLLIDERLTILAGHGRWQAAKECGLKQVPCVVLSKMTSAQKRAYLIADNKLAENAGWDREILALEIKDLIELDAGFDIDVVGLEIAEIDALVEGLRPEEASDPRADQLPAIAERPVTRRGDLWRLGKHKIYCGSTLEKSSFDSLMDSEKADMVFTDPPYNVPIAGNVSGLGKIQHREFAMGAGEMSSAQFTEFLGTAFAHLVENSVDGSIHFLCMDWRHIQELQAAASRKYTELKNLCVWVKANGGMGTFYRSRHELVFAYKNGTAPHVNSFELGQHGRNRSNVWQYAGMNSFGSGRDKELALHPTVKPVDLIVDAIKDVSERGGIVLDCFGGSGSTLIAAHKTARCARLIELDPLYVDRSIRRWEIFAKDDAVLVGNGETFSEVASKRLEIGEGI